MDGGSSLAGAKPVVFLTSVAGCKCAWTYIAENYICSIWLFDLSGVRIVIMPTVKPDAGRVEALKETGFFFFYGFVSKKLA